MFSGKRELLARGLFWSGATFVLNHLAERDSLLILNYHRIGNSAEDPFDPGTFSATAEQLDDQISYLKTCVSLVTLEEALAFIESAPSEKKPRSRVLITFDDGYLDNYELAFPVLRSHGVQGVFFLVTSYVGTSHIPWWDRIHYLMKTARQKRYTLNYPSELLVDTENDGLGRSRQSVLSLYKRPDNTEPKQFFGELREATQGEEPSETSRRFLDWNEAREMIRGGMAIGSHTHTHPIVSQLAAEQQRGELAQSRALLREHLGIDARVLAYPVGGLKSLSEQTEELAREAGYRAAFSFHGGINLPGKMRHYNVNRVGVGDQSWPRFCVQASVCRVTRHYWP